MVIALLIFAIVFVSALACSSSLWKAVFGRQPTARERTLGIEWVYRPAQAAIARLICLAIAIILIVHALDLWLAK